MGTWAGTAATASGVRTNTLPRMVADAARGNRCGADIQRRGVTSHRTRSVGASSAHDGTSTAWSSVARATVAAAATRESSPSVRPSASTSGMPSLSCGSLLSTVERAPAQPSAMCGAATDTARSLGESDATRSAPTPMAHAAAVDAA
eukprot:scaffold26104_cov122-Isochrysis_galbana.AAC.5